jgi:hypothetical protein
MEAVAILRDALLKGALLRMRVFSERLLAHGGT